MNDDDWEEDQTIANDDDPEAAPRYEIVNYPADTTLSGYLEMWNRDELEIPKFQRSYVWDQTRASKLIESFLLGLPVPGVFLFKERESSKYLLIDGQQRIQTVINFLTEKFNERIFRLRNVDEVWNGKTFSELSEHEQFNLNGSVMRATIIQQINPEDRSSIYYIFERLNTGGVNLSSMEIRQCISYAPAIAMLKQANKVDSWRQILGKKQEDKRLRDVELVLRCLALADSSVQYEKPMNSFLNSYAEQMKKFDSQTLDDIQQKFETCCDQILEALGPTPFSLRGRLNYGLLDAVLSTVYSGKSTEGLKSSFDALLSTDGFEDLITQNTSDTSVVRKRIDIARSVLGD